MPVRQRRTTISATCYYKPAARTKPPSATEKRCCRPDYPEAHYNLGTILASAGEYTEALDHLHRAYQGHPEYEAAARAVIEQIEANQ